MYLKILNFLKILNIYGAEKVLRELFFEILPFYYLEQVNNLKYLRKELFLPNSNKRNVYTALGLYQENIFKFWLCEALSNNSKLFCIQHGNNYGTWFENFDTK